MLTLPNQLFSFWYKNSLILFLRVWHNLLSVLEEDLAVSLMWRLILVPLFHDSSIVGRVLSFIFRTTRILLGLAAYIIASLFILALYIGWFLLPLLALIPSLHPLSLIAKLLFLAGLGIFLLKLSSRPLKKVNQVKLASDIWQVTNLTKGEITWENLIKTKEVNELMQSLEIKSDFFENVNFPISDEYLKTVLNLAKKANARFVNAGHFWLAMLKHVPLIETKLLKINLSLADFENALFYLEQSRNKYRAVYIWDDDFAITHLKGINRGWLGAPTPALDAVSFDITLEVSKYKAPEFIGRETTVSEVINILSQENNQNVVIVGSPGVGKSTLVRFLASKIIAGDAPGALATKRLVSLDLARLLAGVTSQGELATKIKEVFDEVSFLQNTIIYVDEIQNLGIGEVSTNYNLYSLMLPYLESNNFQFIATTEPENYAKILEKNSAFARVFTKVELPSANHQETLKIVQEYVIDLEKFSGIKTTFLAIKFSVELSSKIIHERVQPDSALVILNEAQTISKGLITSATIKETIGKRVNVPLENLGSAQKEQLLNLEDLIHQRMIDQEEAVKSVANTLRRAAVSLRESTRPIGSFLFVGPTGVGKTELAKTLAEVYFKDKASFVRFDMSEYQTIDAVNRLIGSADGLGELTEVVRNKPYTLLLLDEFEKANSNILNLFLQVLDDGRLTNSSGKTIDFTNTIIIATSNAASLLIAQGMKNREDLSVLENEVREELLKILKPELVNRFDAVVSFKPLSSMDLEKIVRMKLRDLATLLKNQGYLVDFDPNLISELAKRGFDPVLGARPLRRLIQDTLEAKLSTMILEGRLNKGEIYIANSSLMS